MSRYTILRDAVVATAVIWLLVVVFLGATAAPV